jgi:hypothetical protein
LAAFVSPAVFVAVAFAHQSSSTTLKAMVETGVTLIRDATASGDASDASVRVARTHATIR